MKVELYKHQAKAVEELANGKILRADPGTGKSMTALAYFYIKECGGVLNDWGSLKTPKDVYIITTAKKRNDGDWQRDAYYLGLMENPEISVSGIKVTVDSWNNIEKYKEVTDAFFIFDEQKVVGSGPWAKSFIKIAKANRWILLSATPGDTWLDYAPVFLANGFYKNITEFKQTHVVYSPWHKFPKVERYNRLGRLVRNRNAVLVEMPYERHTTRHLTWVKVDHDQALLERVTKQRWHVYENRPIRDISELFSVARKVVNSAPSRLDQVRKIQKKHKRVIVFYNFDYELELLRTLASSEMVETTGESESEMLLRPTLGTSDSSEPPRKRPSVTSTNLQKTLSSLPGNDEWLTTYSKAGHSSTPSDAMDRTSSSSTRTEQQPAGSQSSWDYLLSPEGQRANAQRQAGDTPRHLYDRPGTSLPKSMTTRISLLTSGIGFIRNVEGSFVSKTGTASMASTDASGPKTGSRVRTVFKEIGGDQPTHRPSLKTPDPTKSGSEETATTSGSVSELRPSTTTSPSVEESGRSGFAIAEWNGHKHEPVPTTDEWIYLVQYAAGSEAWNCTTTDAMLFWSMTYSYKQFEQGQGRIDRLNTPFNDLWYSVLYSDSWIDKAVKESLDTKHDFNEKRYEKKLEADLYAMELVERMAA